MCIPIKLLELANSNIMSEISVLHLIQQRLARNTIEVGDTMSVFP